MSIKKLKKRLDESKKYDVGNGKPFRVTFVFPLRMKFNILLLSSLVTFLFNSLLRDRKKDILPLATHFLDKYNQRRSKALKGFSSRLKEIFLNHTWQGNVRELENVVERAVVIEDADEITVASLPPHIRGAEN